MVRIIIFLSDMCLFIFVDKNADRDQNSSLIIINIFYFNIFSTFRGEHTVIFRPSCRIPCHLFTCHWIRITFIVLCLNLQSLVTDVDEGGWCGRVFCSWFRCFRELPFVYFSGVLSLICLVSTEILVCENQTIWRLEIVLTRIVAALLETNAMAGFLKTKCIKTGKEYCAIKQMIVKDGRAKAIAWRLVSCKMRFYNISEEKNSLNSQCAFCAHFAVCSAHFVLGMQCAFCSL